MLAGCSPVTRIVSGSASALKDIKANSNFCHPYLVGALDSLQTTMQLNRTSKLAVCVAPVERTGKDKQVGKARIGTAARETARVPRSIAPTSCQDEEGRLQCQAAGKKRAS